MSKLEQRYESTLQHGESMIAQDPSVKNNGLVRRSLLEFLCSFGVSVEGAEHITNDPAIYTIIDHPTFMDGPRAYQAVANTPHQLPLLGVTWVDNFLYRGIGDILKKNGNTFPIQRPNAEEKYQKKGMPKIAKNEELLERGNDLNTQTAQFFREMLESQKASLLLSLVHTKSNVHNTLLPFAEEVLETTEAPIIPVSFVLDPKSKKPRALKPSTTTFHAPLTSRENWRTELEKLVVKNDLKNK